MPIIRVIAEDALGFEEVVDRVVEFEAKDDNCNAESSTERRSATGQETFDAMAVRKVS
jgi:hypothetical protein